MKVWQVIHDFFWPPPDPADVAYDKALETYTKYQTNTHNLEDLVSALEIYDTALQLRRSSKNQTELAPLLFNYAVAIWERYRKESDANLDTRKRYLRDIIKFDEEARRLWKATPPKELNQYPTLLTNLANVHFELFRLDPLPELAALTQSLALSQELFDNSSYPEENRYSAAFRIGEILWARYELRTKQPEIQFGDENQGKKAEKAGAQTNTLDEAVAKFKQSLEYAEAHDNSQTRVACYYFMGKTYDARYTLKKQVADLDAALDYNRKARKTLDKNDQRLKTCLYDLCRQLLRKYDGEKGKKNQALLEEAKVIAQGNKFQDILDIIRDRERRKAI